MAVYIKSKVDTVHAIKAYMGVQFHSVAQVGFLQPGLSDHYVCSSQK